jgi:hypothetical protein
VRWLARIDVAIEALTVEIYRPRKPSEAILRRTLQAVAGALDRLLPPHPLELPPEWFKYPPI